MFSRNGIAPGIFSADAYRHLSRRPGLQVRGRDADLPVAAGVHRGNVLNVIDGDGNLRAGSQMGAGAGDGQILLLLNGVDHVIAGNGVHTQARQLCVDVDIALAGTGIAVRIGHRRGEG
ncbi:Uncharacterised protein [Enterobacter cloacae]|nr:Uncharacterised protein [Enterobacter cloacae]